MSLTGWIERELLAASPSGSSPGVRQLDAIVLRTNAIDDVFHLSVGVSANNIWDASAHMHDQYLGT